jgi:hypothetical protein
VADRVGNALDRHLQGDASNGTALMGYLQHLPRLLSSSAALRDSVGLFCTLWGNSRRGRPASVAEGMPAYGKAIRSLLRALQSSRELPIETLASVTVMGRIEYSFHPAESLMYGVHSHAIAHILSKMGPPKQDDHIYMSLLEENYRILVRNRVHSSPFFFPLLFLRLTEI